MANSQNRYAAAHSSPQGPGDARPTAIQIIEDEKLINGLTGKTVLITGCSSGIGVETARALYAAGATVYITVRDVAKGEAVMKDIKDSQPHSTGQLHMLEMELSSLDSVRQAAAELLSREKNLNILICNAGVMACPFGRTQDGFEIQFGTNHLAHFLLLQLLLPTLLSSSTPEFNSREVAVSSIGHRNTRVHLGDYDFQKAGDYTPWAGYGQSKTANIWMANQLDRLYGSRGVHGYSLHPGGIMTPLQRHLDPELVKGWAENKELRKFMKSPEQGAATTVWAATARCWEGKGGVYLEDCQVSKPVNEGYQMTDPGHQKWCYDPEGEERLWKDSLQMVGVEGVA